MQPLVPSTNPLPMSTELVVEPGYIGAEMALLPSRDDMTKAQQRGYRLTTILSEEAKAWHQALEDYDRDYFLENSGDMTGRPDSERVRLSDLADGVTIAQSILKTGLYRIKLEQPGERVKEKTKAEAIQTLLKGVVDWSQGRTGEHAVDRLTEYTARYGAGILHWVYGADMLPDSGTAAYSPPLNRPPIEVYAVNPESFFCILGGPNGQFRWAGTQEEKTLAEIDEFVHGSLGTSPHAKALAERELAEWYSRHTDDERHTYRAPFWNLWGWEMIEGQWKVVNLLMYGNAVLRPFEIMEGYDHLPWALASAQDTGEKDLAKRWLPIHYHAKPHVRRAERLQGQMDQMMEDIVDMPATVSGSDAYPEPPTVVAGRRNAIKLEPGQSYSSPNYGQLPRDLYPQLEIVNSRIYQSLFSPAMYGVGGQGSGYAFDQSQEGGKLRLIGMRNGLSQALKRMFEGICSLIARHAPDQPVYAVYVDSDSAVPDDQRVRVVVTGKELLGWQIKVEWSTDMPGDDMRRTAQAVQLRGLVPDSRLLERLGYDSPQQEIQTRLLEKVMDSHPAFAEAVAYIAMQERGAIPDMRMARQEALAHKLQTAEGEARALAAAQGASPEQQESFAQFARQKLAEQELQKMMSALVPALQPMTQGQPIGAQGQGNQLPGQMPAAPGPPPPQAQNPMSDPANGMQYQGQMGPPPGNPADLGAEQRQLANLLNGQGQ